MTSSKQMHLTCIVRPPIDNNVCQASVEIKIRDEAFVQPRWVRTIPVRPFNRDVHLHNEQTKQGGGKNNCERNGANS